MSTWQWHTEPTNDAANDELIWARLRARRDQLLTLTDFRVLPDAPWDRAPWEAYRQALRNLPKSSSDPRQAVWPEPPTV